VSNPWPRNLAGQLVLIVLVALLAGQALSLLVFADERRMALRAANREQVLARTAGLVRLLEETPATLHGRILKASSGALVRFDGGPASAVDASDAWHRRNPIAVQLEHLLGGNGGRPVLVDFADERRIVNLIGFEGMDQNRWRPDRPRRRHGPIALAVAVQLADGNWLNAQTFTQPAPGWALPNLATLGLTAGLVALGVLLAVRKVTRPMTRLAAAADALGRGEAPPPLAEVGPADVRATVQAFNRMQGRLRRFVDDRTRMLAAIGHDLRTPITSLRLRAEFVDDADTKARILATLDEMQKMVEGTLDFVREEAANEPTRTVDLAALVDSTVLDLADLGADVAFAESGRVTLACRPAALAQPDRKCRALWKSLPRLPGRWPWRDSNRDRGRGPWHPRG
jgi:signal transduction histidine kinase